MVKSWIGAAGMGAVGAAPLFEPVPLAANWSYPETPAMGALLDDSDNVTHNIPTGISRPAANCRMDRK